MAGFWGSVQMILSFNYGVIMRNVSVIRGAIFLIILIIANSALAQELSWQVGYHKTKSEQPVEWYKAIVPGAVQLDYANAKKMGDYMYAENWRDYRWMEDVYWTYKTEFGRPELNEDELLYFISKGIDYKFEIFLNGEEIFVQEGMFKAVELDLTDKLKDKNELEVLIYPVPKVQGMPDDRQQASQSTKPAVSYGWDWHPRLIPSGIWDETYLEERNSSHLTDVFVDYQMSDDFRKAIISISAEGKGIEDKSFEWVLNNPDEGKVILGKGRISELKSKTFEIYNPKLWWTHDHGVPYLYQSVFKLIDLKGNVLDKKEQKIGFRRIKLVMHEGAWNEPSTFPKGRSNPPVTLELNGRRIFGKGSNWVNPEIFPGIITKECYNDLLENALKANFNIFRVWGGGIVNKESFYELCDEKGILVWTEFPLACNNYKGTPSYLKVLEQESEAIIKRVRKHASNAIWSGGNELFNAWSGMTDQSLALRLLNSRCYNLDPKTPYINTSPLMGMAHGHYVFRDFFNSSEEVFQWMPRSKATAYTEFGMPGAASVKLLEKIIPEDELWPPKAGTSWESHHAFNAWVGNTWLMSDMLEDYFGKPVDLKQLVAQSQWTQREGYKCIFEEARRQKPVAAMALNWCYNEPWITAANNSLISYPNEPKPAFYAVANSCRPFLASARIPKFSWREGEEFYCDVYILNDLYEDIPSGKVTIKLRTGEEELKLLTWEFEKAKANKNIKGPTVRGMLPHWDADRFDVVLEVEDKPQYSSSYTLPYKPVREKAKRNEVRQLNN